MPFEPRSILVTGGAGFIGSHVATHLATTFEELHIVVLDRLDVCASLHNLTTLQASKNFAFVQGDVGNQLLMTKVLTEHKVGVASTLSRLGRRTLSFFPI
jgi:dTDP-D-glucose 4,6-dehydratase